ncbi:MAG: hypothetical protein DRQ51_01550 [Gammaproteobacteria bacterium]|nr:MAG: hypothetical protein DRQ51_01550 [Gammaproteobacteria bacterium]
MIKKFSNLSNREKILIISLLLVAVPLVVYNFMLMPLLDDYSKNKNDLISNLQTLNFIKSNSYLLNKTQNIDKNKSILIRTDETISKMELPIPAKIQPIGKNSIKLEFKNIKYKSLMQFILKMRQTHAITVKNIAVKKTSAGMVSCLLTLRNL